MPFVDKELQQLSQDIINRAVKKQSGIGTPNLLVDKLRQSILRRQTKLPRV